MGHAGYVKAAHGATDAITEFTELKGENQYQ